MATVKITEQDGRVIEIADITIDEAKRLISPNGHSHAPAPTKNATKHLPVEQPPDFQGFGRSLSENARKFFKVLKEHPNGITNDQLAEKMGFNSTNQIGGVTGGGVVKRAKKFYVKTDSVWTVSTRFENGGRTVVYRPGPQIDLIF